MTGMSPRFAILVSHLISKENPVSINRSTLIDNATARTPLRERISRATVRAFFAARERLASERGDVPGWVLITLMTAGIVVALWAVASDALVGLFNQAMSQFTE